MFNWERKLAYNCFYFPLTKLDIASMCKLSVCHTETLLFLQVYRGRVSKKIPSHENVFSCVTTGKTNQFIQTGNYSFTKREVLSLSSYYMNGCKNKAVSQLTLRYCCKDRI